MKNNETGEYELVVGNPQLLSAFFIVALLCGVAFAMGYVVGQNAPHSAKTAAAPAGVPAAGDAGSPPVSSPPVQSPAAAPPAQTPDNPEQPPAGDAAKPAEPPPQPTTQAARETPPAAQAPDAPAGSYWQVAALSKPADAQPIAQTLRDGSMPVVVRQGPDGLTHVLVGPYSDTQSLSRAKNELQTRFGIPNPIRK